MNKKAKDRLCTVIMLSVELGFAGTFYVMSNDLNKVVETNFMLSLLSFIIQIMGYSFISFALATSILRLVVGEALIKISPEKRKRVFLYACLIPVLLAAVVCLCFVWYMYF